MDTEASTIPPHVLPSTAELSHALGSMHRQVPLTGTGLESVQRHLSEDVAPAFNAGSQSSRYYGFVTGGATPAAVFADNMVTEYDQNVQVHLPNETIATDVEAASLDMICDLLGFSNKNFPHRTYTTGATASNIIGLACGREYVISATAARNGTTANVSSMGLIAAMRVAELDDIQVLTSVPHSSLRKAASIIGLGHDSVRDVGRASEPHLFDFAALEKALKTPRTASIVVVSCSEVNSGLFATSEDDMTNLVDLAKKYGAWIHVDAAFGLLARILPDNHSNYKILRSGVKGLEHADSIAADAHKLFNVPYDCGILLSRHLDIGTAVFQNPGAPYLNAAAGSVPSPLNIGIENSRRFRALPVYANLVAYGREGFVDMLERQIALARTIAAYMIDSDDYELLPLISGDASKEEVLQRVYIIVLFRAREEALNVELVKKINASRKIYVSGTKWGGQPACRFAISNWQASVDRDWSTVKEVLDSVVTDAADDKVWTG
ncbi:PLP-dependent transferase [Aureobasidium subglaciale]|nr:PLP-dependent transferase [Aureobasidium subglaciale]